MSSWFKPQRNIARKGLPKRLPQLGSECFDPDYVNYESRVLESGANTPCRPRMDLKDMETNTDFSTSMLAHSNNYSHKFLFRAPKIRIKNTSVKIITPVSFSPDFSPSPSVIRKKSLGFLRKSIIRNQYYPGHSPYRKPQASRKLLKITAFDYK